MAILLPPFFFQNYVRSEPRDVAYVGAGVAAPCGRGANARNVVWVNRGQPIDKGKVKEEMRQLVRRIKKKRSITCSMAVIGIISIGEMGLGVGRLLKAHGIRVVTNASERRQEAQLLAP